jgi:hypothetical protein
MAGFDAYHVWLGIPPAEQPPNHYRLLGIPLLEQDAEVIANAADQRMSYLRTVQSGPYSIDAARILNELAAAKVCLLKAERKLAYDAQLQAKIPEQRVAANLLARFPSMTEAPITPPAVAPPRVNDQGFVDLPRPLSATRRTAESWTPFEEIESTSTETPSKRKSKTWVALFLMFSSSVIGVSLGYLILCSFGPKYDFLSLFQEGPVQEKPKPNLQGPEIPLPTAKPAKVVEPTNPQPVQKPPARVLTSAKYANQERRVIQLLAERNVDEASTTLSDLRVQLLKPEDKEKLERISYLYSLVRPFWREVKSEMGDLKPGTEISINGEKVIVVESDSEKIQLRCGGTNDTFSVLTMPMSLAEAMYGRRKPAGFQGLPLTLGSVHSVDVMGDRDRGMEFLKTAVAEGLLDTYQYNRMVQLPPAKDVQVWPPAGPRSLPNDPPQAVNLADLPIEFELPKLLERQPVILGNVQGDCDLKLRSFPDAALLTTLIARPSKEKIREWDVLVEQNGAAKAPGDIQGQGKPVGRFRVDDGKLLFAWLADDPATGAGALRNAILFVETNDKAQRIGLRIPTRESAMPLNLEKASYTVEFPIADAPSTALLRWQIGKFDTLEGHELSEEGLIALDKRIIIRMKQFDGCRIECAASRRADRMVVIFKPVVRLPGRHAFPWTVEGVEEEIRSLNAAYQAAERDLPNCESKLREAEQMLSAAQNRTLPSSNPARGLAALQRDTDIGNVQRMIRSNRKRITTIQRNLPLIKDRMTQLEPIETLRRQLHLSSQIHLRMVAEANGETLELVRCGDK